MNASTQLTSRVGALCLILLGAASAVSARTTVSAQAPSSDDGKASKNKAERTRAREAYAAGLTALEHGQLDLAVENFRLAHSLIPHENTVQAIASVQEKQGREQEALKTLESFFTDLKTRSKRVQGWIERLRASLPATLVLTSDSPGWAVRIDGVTEAATTPTKVEVSPGTHTVELVSEQGQRVERKEQMQPGVTYTVHGSNIKTEPTEDDGPNVAAWVFGSLTVAALGTGVGFGLAALDSKSQYEDQPTVERYDTTNRYALISDVAFAGAAVFAVGTIVSLVVESDDERQVAQGGLDLRIEPSASTTAVGLSAEGSF